MARKAIQARGWTTMAHRSTEMARSALRAAKVRTKPALRTTQGMNTQPAMKAMA